MFKIVFLLALNIGTIQYVSTVCNECSKLTGVACKNETAFHLCFKDKPDTTQTFSCPNPEDICTTRSITCVSKIDNPHIKPACGDTSNCGICKNIENGRYTCTSRTTFTMCFDEELSDVSFTCPDKQMCDVSKAKNGENPCVSHCMGSTIKYCDLTFPINTIRTTTRTPIKTTKFPTKFPTTLPTTFPTTFLTTKNPISHVCTQQAKVGRYPYPNDTTCKRYILCFRRGGQMQTRFLECPSGLYFNPSISSCKTNKPAGCV